MGKRRHLRRTPLTRERSRPICKAHGRSPYSGTSPQNYRTGCVSTTVLLAASPLVEGRSGEYYDDCQKASVVEERGNGPFKGVAHYAIDEDNAERLWGMAENLLGREGMSGPLNVGFIGIGDPGRADGGRDR